MNCLVEIFIYRKKEIDGLVMEMITKNEENETDEEDSNVSTKDDRTHEDSEEVVKKENESAESSSEEIEEVKNCIFVFIILYYCHKLIHF